MQQMRLISVNTGTAQWLQHDGRRYQTGIGKRPANGPVRVRASGLSGDQVCNRKHHGGPDQAVYAYGQDDYAWWSSSLNRPLAPGTFGENLTVEGLPTDLGIGERLLIGSVVLEVTAPRIPCRTLEAALGIERFAERFRRAARPGAYLRVLNAGELQAGDAVTALPAADGAPGIVELFRHYYDWSSDAGPGDAASIRRFLDAPLASRLRAKFERRLALLEGESQPA